MPSYKTAGVYVEEIATLPPSVAEVSTAVPAFIGVTEKVPEGKDFTPYRISNLLEYEGLFGKAVNMAYKFDVVRDSATNALTIFDDSDKNQQLSSLHYAMRMFYDNGGGACWIVSLGDISKSTLANYEKAIDAINTLDEPTLLVTPHSSVDLTAVDFVTLSQYMISSCGKFKDRFAIIDIPNADGSVDTFRNTIGSDNLSYGAAYTPFLNTTMAYQYSESDSVNVKITTSTGGTLKYSSVTTSAISFDPVALANSSLIIGKNLSYAANDAVKLQYSTSPDVNVFAKGSVVSYDATTGDIVVGITAVGDTAFAATRILSIDIDRVSLSSIATTQTDVYQAVKSQIKNMPTIVAPPSASIAGIYARVDRQSGVWKAPANVSVSSIIGPVRNIGNDEQDNLNVDTTGGKSINVIRSFAGRGTLVWGARTLAGNDNEWRYIPVRRLFITVEESIQKATAFAVFEPNDISTWLKVKAMIESYLYGLWQQGALAGSSPDAAYFVNVGLGKTMTQDNINEGLMIFEVGIAAVRPAEFIILRFSHMLQTA